MLLIKELELIHFLSKICLFLKPYDVEVDGKLMPTTKAKIHYSKTGSHIVPFRDKEDK
jgi:hypothetical protein